MSTFEIILICFLVWGALMLCAIFTFYIFKTKMNNKKFLVQNHRELWTFYCNNIDELKDLFNDNAKPRALSEKETKFAIMLTTHAECAYTMLKTDLIFKTSKKAFLKDFAKVYSKPLMRIYWEKTKQFHSDDFAKQINKFLENK